MIKSRILVEAFGSKYMYDVIVKWKYYLLSHSNSVHLVTGLDIRIGKLFMYKLVFDCKLCLC